MVSNLEHRIGVTEATLVVRHLKLSNINKINLPFILDEIDQTFGVDNVSFDQKSSTLIVAYDALNFNLDGIAQITQKHGADIARDWWTHFKERYYKFTDQNIKDNAEYVPSCCSKPPTGIKK